MANKLVCTGPSHEKPKFLGKDSHDKILFNGKYYCVRCWNMMVRDSIPLDRDNFIDDLQAGLQEEPLQPTAFGLIKDKFQIERGWDE